MNGISGMYGYPYQYQSTANPVGAGAVDLNSQYAQDFGLGTAPVYGLPIDVNMGYGYGGGMMPGMGMYNPYTMISPKYREYLNMDFKDRLVYDAELRDAARETQYGEGKSAKNYASATDGLTGSIREACNSLQTVIIEGESDQIPVQFERIVNSLRHSPLYVRLQEEFKDDPVRLEMTLRNCAKEQFQAATGQDLKALIQENCDSALTNAFWNTISFGNAQKYSAEDIISKIEGTQTPKSVKTKEVFGKTGGVLAAIGTGAAVGCIFGGPVIGGVIGGVVGLVGALTS